MDDNDLLIVCDWIPPKQSELTPDSKIFVWHSSDAGASWGAKKDTQIRGHICPGIIRLKSGTIILGASRFDSIAENEVPEMRSSVWREAKDRNLV